MHIKKHENTFGVFLSVIDSYDLHLMKSKKPLVLLN